MTIKYKMSDFNKENQSNFCCMNAKCAAKFSLSNTELTFCLCPVCGADSIRVMPPPEEVVEEVSTTFKLVSETVRPKRPPQLYQSFRAG